MSAFVQSPQLLMLCVQHAMPLPLCKATRRASCCLEADAYDSILDEIDDDDDDWADNMLTEAEEQWAVELEECIIRGQLSRAGMEQDMLGPGAPLPLCENAAAAKAALSEAGAGVARLGGTLSPATAAALRAYVLAELSDATREPVASCLRLSHVIAPTAASGSTTATRWDLRLPMSPIVRTALQEVLSEGGALGEALEEAAGGGQAELWELGALISCSGAAAQVVHADVVWRPTPSLHTAFIALQPICRALGPTRFLPYTHANKHAHAAHVAQGDATALTVANCYDERFGAPPMEPCDQLMPSVVALLDTGDAALYDARCFHCGGANTFEANQPRQLGPEGDASGDGCVDASLDGMRILFYLTTRHAARMAEPVVPDPGRSLLPHLDGAFTLGALRAGRFEIDEMRLMRRRMEQQQASSRQ